VLNYLDPRYLASLRNGTGTYVNGSGISPIGGSPIGFAGAEMVQVFSVIR